ncbi:lipid A 4'-phosphatase [Gammaproteobacteria bacterium]
MKISLMVGTVALAFLTSGKVEASDTIRTVGEGISVALPGAALIMAMSYADRNGAIQFAESYGVATVVTFGLKYAINEQRPNGEGHSFPSFHTSSSFAAAAFIQNRYGWFYGAPAYLASSLVGWSRIESREHWGKDVIGGAVLGIAAGWFFTKPYKDVELAPVVGNHFMGIQISKRL